MSKIQPEQGSSKSTRPEPKKIPNGWAPAPASLIQDAEISDPAFRLWCFLEQSQGKHGQSQFKVETIAAKMGKSVSTIGRALKELTAAGFLEIVRTRGASFYKITHPDLIKKGHKRPTRSVKNDRYIYQEVFNEINTSKQVPALTTEDTPTRSDKSRESLSTTATDKTAVRAEMLLLSLPAQQRPALTNRTLRVFEKLFDMGYSEPEVLAHLKETITNPKARAGLTVETLEALTQIPHRESNTAPHTATKAEQQAQELEEVWGSQGEPQEQIDQFEENSREWIAAIRADLNKRNSGKVSA